MRTKEAKEITEFANRCYAQGLSDGQKKFEAVRKWVDGLPNNNIFYVYELKSKLDEIERAK